VQNIKNRKIEVADKKRICDQHGLVDAIRVREEPERR
jgi:hypothetical protein